MSEAESLNESPICFYHGADNDGKLSGALIKLYYEDCGENVEMYPFDYGQTFPWELVKGREVIMVDLALQPFSEMVKLKAEASVLIWIDHHASAIDEYSKLEDQNMGGVQNVKFAACEFTWMFRPDNARIPHTQIPFGIKMVGRYDVWDHSNPDALPFKYGLEARQIDPSKSDCDWDLIRAMEEGSPELVCEVLREGRIMHKYAQADFKRYAESAAFDTVIDGHRVVALNRMYGGSQSIESVFKKGVHEFMVAFGYMPKSNNQWTVGMYSDEGLIDLGALAKKFGGGGHKGAAGFQIGTEGISKLCSGELNPPQ